MVDSIDWSYESSVVDESLSRVDHNLCEGDDAIHADVGVCATTASWILSADGLKYYLLLSNLNVSKLCLNSTIWRRELK